MTPADEPTGADVFLQRLGELGIDTIFVNAGTDFPPIVEALAKAAVRGRPLQAIAVPHENLTVSMAKRAWCGRP
jgi:acetolactate synthase-1/2/3 large subunit